MLCSIFQRYKSRAIHNSCAFISEFITAVFNISKIQIESNSQPGRCAQGNSACCVQYFKDTNREQFTTTLGSKAYLRMLCSIFQRYKSRAIHNSDTILFTTVDAVFNISKIQIESNSQLNERQSFHSGSCVQYFKDTNREQFTTYLSFVPSYKQLCSIFQRYKSRAIHNHE